MKHPALQKKLHDAEYERRFNRFFLTHMVGLVPMMVFGLCIWGEFGRIPLFALSVSASTYSLVVVILDRIARRETLAGMRREGIIEGDYAPPAF